MGELNALSKKKRCLFFVDKKDRTGKKFKTIESEMKFFETIGEVEEFANREYKKHEPCRIVVIGGFRTTIYIGEEVSNE